MKNRCCICRKEDEAQFFRKEGSYELFKCFRCDLVFLGEIPERLEKFIDDAQSGENGPEFWSQPLYFEKYKPIFESYFEERLARLKSYEIPRGKFLDVGVGFGFWGQFLINKGYAVAGIDVSQSAVDYVNNSENGLSATCVSFEDFETSEKYSAIFMFDVLEHFVEPDEMLEKAKRMLSPGGVVYVQVPNVIGLRIPYGHNLGLPFHLWQFNKSSLAALFKKVGMSQSIRFWFGVQGVIGTYERGGPSLKTKLLWTCAKWLKLGNRIQAVGQKSKS